MFTSTLFFLAIFIYAGLVFGYKPFLRSQVNKLNDRIQSFGQQVSLEDQTKIVSFYSQLANVKTILGNHVFVSPVFRLLEKTTQGNVFFTKLALTVASRQMLLGGLAKSLNDATEQVQIFQNQPEVERVVLNNLGAGQGGRWQFDITLTLTPGFFKQQSQAPPESVEIPTETP